ncbi:MAG: nitrile hydratase subunit alpha [Simkania sp.]|nr:nitrile hydratase subunit alpha [Simkania sp.]
MDQLDKTWAKIVMKCWNDESFKKRAIANPAEVLKEHGFTTPTPIHYKVVEEKNANETYGYLSLPMTPKASELDKALKMLEEEIRQTKGPGFCHIWSLIIAKSWQDPAFRKRTISNPEEVLKEHGFVSNSKARLKVIEEKAGEHFLHLTLPKKPASTELAEEELRQVGGWCYSCNGI